MSQTVKAIFEHGVLRPLEKVDLSEHPQVELTIRALEASDTQSDQLSEKDPLDGLPQATGIKDLAEHFDDYRFGRRVP